jgi:lipoate-protein ligase A
VLPPLRVHRQGFPGKPAFDTAVSRALLAGAAAGRVPESLRLYRPDDVLAFSPLDAVRPGFARAVAAARDAGFEPVRRLAGGSAAVFHRETLAFAWCTPDPAPRLGIRRRFEVVAELAARALRRLGVDARVGAVPGEYCPGDHSVNARGRLKLMGVGQRIVRGAVHVGGVLVVRDGARVREALVPVYAALGIDWEPASAGSVEDEVPGVTRDDVAEALLAELARERVLREAVIEPAVLAHAESLAPDHRL